MNEDSNMTKRKTLDLYMLDDEIYPPFERAKGLAEDIRKALSDGKIFNESVRPEIPKAMLKAVDDSFVNLLSEEGISSENMVDSSLAENMYLSISEAIENAINSEQFINQLGLEIARIELLCQNENNEEVGG